MDWTLDSIISIARVKGHMHINQQQSFEYISFVGCRVFYQSLLTVIILTVYSCYEMDIRKK